MTDFALGNTPFTFWKFDDGAEESYERNQMAFIDKEIDNADEMLRARTLSYCVSSAFNAWHLINAAVLQNV